MQPEGSSLPNAQQRATCSYPEQDQSSPPQPISLRSILTIQHKPTKCTLSKLIFKFLISMSSTCFEREGSSSGRRLCIQVWYSSFTYINISSLVGSRLRSILLVLTHVQVDTIPLYTGVLISP